MEYFWQFSHNRIVSLSFRDQNTNVLGFKKYVLDYLSIIFVPRIILFSCRDQNTKVLGFKNIFWNIDNFLTIPIVSCNFLNSIFISGNPTLTGKMWCVCQCPMHRMYVCRPIPPSYSQITHIQPPHTKIAAKTHTFTQNYNCKSQLHVNLFTNFSFTRN